MLKLQQIINAMTSEEINKALKERRSYREKKFNIKYIYNIEENIKEKKWKIMVMTIQEIY